MAEEQWINNRNILFVDDEESIRDAYKTILAPTRKVTSRRLARKGNTQPEYNLFFASSGEEAVEIYRTQLEKGDPIAAGFFDMIMPGGIDGGETIRQIRAINPFLMCVIVTAYADRDPKEIREFFDDQSMWLYLNKPFNDGEIRQLAANMVNAWNLRKMNQEYRENLEELVKQRTEALNAELEKVAIVQRNLLPQKIPHYENLDIGLYYETCVELGGGGDYYDVVELPGDRLGIVIADASGHGPSAACIMAITRTVFRELAFITDSPGDLMEQLNDKVSGNYPRGNFVTMFYAILDLKTGMLSTSNAAHPFPIYGQRGKYKLLEGGTGMILGMFPSQYPETDVRLEPNDLLFMFTDGIEEHKDAQRNEYGYERILKTMEDHGHLAPNQFIKALVADADNFREGLPREDDFTFVALRWRPPQNKE